MAVVTATRLTEFVCSSIPHDKQRVRVYFWTDSHNSKPFIAHWVKEINESFPTAMWSFTPSADNPANLLTRGLSAIQLKSSRLWTCGPDWLLDRSTWPTWTPTSALHLQTEEEASPTPVAQPTEESTENEPCVLSIIDISQYSSIYRLIAVTAYILRFIHNHHKVQHRFSVKYRSSYCPKTPNQGCTGTDIPRQIYLYDQKRSKCPSLIRQLRLFLDSDQLICCSGSIHNAPTTELAVLLPANFPFTDLIVMDTHTKLHHGGVSITVTALRQVYWIPSTLQYIKKLLRRCVTCKKLMGKPYRAPDPHHFQRHALQNPSHSPSLGWISLVPCILRTEKEKRKYTSAFSLAQSHMQYTLK